MKGITITKDIIMGNRPDKKDIEPPEFEPIQMGFGKNYIRLPQVTYTCKLCGKRTANNIIINCRLWTDDIDVTINQTIQVCADCARNLAAQEKVVAANFLKICRGPSGFIIQWLI